MLEMLIPAAANIIGGIMGQKSQEKQADKNIALQKEFAQSGIQWKVNDAKAAGVHPLYALGANTTSFSPVSIGSPLAEGISRAGQHLGRAVNATATPDQRAVANLQLDHMALQNELLRTQIASERARANQAGVPPAMPSAEQKWLLDGQGQAPVPGTVVDWSGIKKKPFEITTTAGVGGTEPMSVPDVGYTFTGRGWAPALSKEAQERMEDDFIGQTAHAWRNRVLPMFSRDNMVPPPFVNLKEGEKWMWDPFRQEYYIMKGNSFWRPRGPR